MAISVVTCCMNRNDHLEKNVRQWLDRDWVEQVVIVDWSSTTPVAETLRDVPKDKIRIIRAEGETHWLLCYAYNLGVIHATGDMILKIDADCLVGDRLIVDCWPDDKRFYAGNLHSGNRTGKGGSVNGQCFFTRAAFEAVNGFHELLRGWGQDDEDFYQRLIAQGLVRLEMDCDLLDFIHHTPNDRTVHTPQNARARNTQQFLEAKPTFQDWRNRSVVRQMPWGPWFPRARYRRLAIAGAVTTVERRRDLEIRIPDAVMEMANLEAGFRALNGLNIDADPRQVRTYRTVVDLYERWIVETQLQPGWGCGLRVEAKAWSKPGLIDCLFVCRTNRPGLRQMAISVVTCCMNRNEHLARTVRQWLDRDWVEQVVIVDWSSATPVAETLRDIPQDKISIVRAEGEDEWILTFAYNLGVLYATGDMILKIDADCVVNDRLFVECQPDDTAFYAGDLRIANERGILASVNGQCFFTRRAFEAVNGFNELLRGWSQDDEDFYQRLTEHGFARREIDCELFAFIDHPIEARLRPMPKAFDGRLAQHLLEQQVTVQDWKNCVVVGQMPWGQWFPRARYRHLGAEGAVIRVERRRDLEIKVPAAVLEKARLEAGRAALERLGIDTGGAEPADYTTVVDRFEQWVMANLIKPDPVIVTSESDR